MTEDELRESEFFARFMDPICASNALSALSGGSGVLTVQLSVCRDATARHFCDRSRGILGVLASALERRMERCLTTSRQKGLHDLSRRERQVLEALPAGDSEKQVASKLAISLPAVHDHVGALYRYFGAHSRGELLAYFIHRRPALKQPPSARARNGPAEKVPARRSSWARV